MARDTSQRRPLASLPTTRSRLSSAIILLHGLFGDKENLGALARALAGEFRVIQVDLPNHGDSPHQADMAYPACVTNCTSRRTRFRQSSSAGALPRRQAGNAVCLRHPLRVNRLIVVDMAPVAPRHESVFTALQAVVDRGAGPSRRRSWRRSWPIPRPPVLIEELSRRWWLAFQPAALKANYLMLMSWPSPESSFAGPSLFIKGGQSDYLLPEHQSLVSHYFPDAKARIIPDAGHWLHAEKPLLFNRLVVDFLSTSR